MAAELGQFAAYGAAGRDRIASGGQRAVDKSGGEGLVRSHPLVLVECESGAQAVHEAGRAFEPLGGDAAAIGMTQKETAPLGDRLALQDLGFGLGCGLGDDHCACQHDSQQNAPAETDADRLHFNDTHVSLLAPGAAGPGRPQTGARREHSR